MSSSSLKNLTYHRLVLYIIVHISAKSFHRILGRAMRWDREDGIDQVSVEGNGYPT